MFKIRNKIRGAPKKVWFKTPHFKKSGPHAYLSDLFAWCRNFVKDALATFINIKKVKKKKKNLKNMDKRNTLYLHKLGYLGIIRLITREILQSPDKSSNWRQVAMGDKNLRSDTHHPMDVFYCICPIKTQ